MTLDNLLGKSLEAIAPDAGAIRRLLEAAQRNIADYSGDLITESTMKECLRQADQLFTIVSEWLEALFPELR